MCCNIRYHYPVVDWFAHLESSLRKSGGWSGSNSGLPSSLHYIVQYHGQVPLDGIEADSAKLSVKPPGYSVSLTRPRVLLPLHECLWISCSNWYVLSFCLHECCRCELALNEDVKPLLKRVDLLLRKQRLVRLEFETYECKMMNDVYAKIDTFFYLSKDFVKVIVNIAEEHRFIW